MSLESAVPGCSILQEQSLAAEEAVRNFLRLFPLLVNLPVHLAHGRRVDLAGQEIEDLPQLGEPLERLGADERNGLVRRKVAAIVVELEQIEGGDSVLGDYLAREAAVRSLAPVEGRVKIPCCALGVR